MQVDTPNAGPIVDDDETMSAIRAMLNEPGETKMDSEPKAAAAQAVPAPVVYEVEIPSDASESQTPSPKPGINRARLKPSRKVLIWGGVALMIALRPHLFVIGAVLMLMVVGGCFAIFGSEAVWNAVMRLFSRYARIAPQRAETFAKRIDAFALRWDGFLDRFPDGSVDGLYLPDFQSQKQADDRHDAVVAERLARMQANA